jgi:hypothetical protein
MKVIEILKLGREMMKALQESCIKIDDYKYIEMYEEYKSITDAGGKTSYAVALLAEQYGISERKVYYLLRKLSKDCMIGAVG